SSLASGVWWAAYEWTKLGLFSYYHRTYANRNGAPSAAKGTAAAATPTLSRYSAAAYAVQLAAGSLAGGLAAIITNPFDIVKTRLQTQSSHFACKQTTAISAAGGAVAGVAS